MNQPATAAIILAAGSSSRMGGGRHKLLLPLADRPVLAHVIDATLQSKARPIVVVLGHQAAQVREQIAPFTAHSAITHVENHEYLQGMSTSLRAGLTYVQYVQYEQSHANAPSNTIDSIIILLGDQPLITARIIDSLIDTYHATHANIVAPLYNGKRGNPVLFAASLFPELLEVSGDEGGRTVVERHRQEVAKVELGDAMDVMANYDVDTWEAYQQVVALWQQNKLNNEQEKM